MSDELIIAGKSVTSRLILGTGKYASPELCREALDASGTEIVTVAIRRLDLDNPDKETELDYIDWSRYTILPNTAGCKTVEEALLTARLGRELTGSDWVKLEVIPDPKYLLPDPIGTLEAARILLDEGFAVLPYTHADPVLARRLEELGCATVEEALLTARLGRELTGSDWVKLEVIPDPQYLLPDAIGTLEAAQTLIDEGFSVLPYIHADPVLATRLAEIGCVTVMPLGSAIGSGQGILTLDEIKIIIEQAQVPVVVDAGIGAPSDAALAMESGADCVLLNTAVALSENPVQMAEAMKLGVEAGRSAFLAGRIPKKPFASASSPEEGVASVPAALSASDDDAVTAARRRQPVS